ncbi:MAG: tetratricopeptide repeat protein [Acidobacteria bacterium]|nr:tetratricopeptide repeat protein [Acidobacteriota bacterium]
MRTRALLRLRRWRRSVLVACLAALGITGAAGMASGQTAGTVRGAVVDERSRAAVAGALIVLLPLDGDGPSLEFETGSDGRFARSDVAPGLYAVTAALGALQSEVYRVRVRDRLAVEIRFALGPDRGATPWIIAGGARDRLDELFAAGVGANREGAHNEAVTWFTLAAGLDPNCIECHYNVGVAYSALERWPAAERAFEDALAIRRDYTAAYYGLANVFTRSGRPDDASRARDEATRLTLAALEAGRRQAAAEVARGIAFLEAGNVEDARQRFEEAVGGSPGYAPAYYWLGVALTEIGRSGAALTALRRAVSLDGSGEHAADARSRIAALER